MSCKFCTDLKDIKTANRESRKDVIVLGGKPRRHYYYVAIVERLAGKLGRTTWYQYKLNYCPECGKYLKRR